MAGIARLVTIDAILSSRSVEVMGPPPEGAQPPPFEVLEARDVMTG